MNVYPLAESELEQISSTSAKGTFWWSISTLSIGIGATLFASASTLADPFTSAQIAMFRIAPWLFIGVAVLAALAAGNELRQRRSMLNKIKAECAKAGTLSMR